MTDEFPGRRRARHVVELSRYLERLNSPELARLEQLDALERYLKGGAA